VGYIGLGQNKYLISNMRGTAIVIDDDFDSVDIFCSLLEEINISILGRGYSGKEAIDLFKELKPNFVFLDLSMPEGTGFHAIRKIKELDDSAKIIAVTANEDFATRRKLKELNVYGAIFKPIDMDKIQKLVSNSSVS